MHACTEDGVGDPGAVADVAIEVASGVVRGQGFHFDAVGAVDDACRVGVVGKPQRTLCIFT